MRDMTPKINGYNYNVYVPTLRVSQASDFLSAI